VSNTIWLEDAPGKATYFSYGEEEDEAEWIIEWFDDSPTIPPNVSYLAEELLTEIDCITCYHCGHGVGMTLAGENDEYTQWESCAIVDKSFDQQYVVCDECYDKEYGNEL